MWNQTKISEVAEFISADRIHHSGVNVFPGRGSDDVKQMIQTWKRGFPDFQYQVQDLIGEGDVVTANTTFTGTHTGVFRLGPYTLPPTGNPIEEVEIFIYRIKEGKIVESWAAWDQFSLLKQLGVNLDPAQVIPQT